MTLTAVEIASTAIQDHEPVHIGEQTVEPVGISEEQKRYIARSALLNHGVFEIDPDKRVLIF